MAIHRSREEDVSYHFIARGYRLRLQPRVQATAYSLQPTANSQQANSSLNRRLVEHQRSCRVQTGSLAVFQFSMMQRTNHHPGPTFCLSVATNKMRWPLFISCPSPFLASSLGSFGLSSSSPLSVDGLVLYPPSPLFSLLSSLVPLLVSS